jgi:regulator of cell morphogenesis and NO signaling
MPQIYGHLNKVAIKHGDRFPYMKEVLGLFAELRREMTDHMEAEETILFPRIKGIENLPATNHEVSALIPTLEEMVGTMETEHDRAGQIMFKIRLLTNNYVAPQDACTSFKVSLTELKEFEEDLHQHVHLENNILFPGAMGKTV